MSKPKLLFLSQTLPFPPDSGVKVRTYHTLQILSERFEVYALCFYRKGHTGEATDVQGSVEGLSRFASIQAFPIPEEWSSARRVNNHVRSLLTGRAYTKYVYEEEEYRSAISRLLEEHDFAAVHFESLDLVTYLDDGLEVDLPIVCVHHNVESRLLRRRATRSENSLLGRYIAHQAKLTEREEKNWAGRVELNVMVSEDDAATLEAIQPEARTIVVPNGVDTDFFQPGESHCGETIAFLGGTEWFPNRDGLEFFAEEILPLVRDARPDVTVEAIGRCSEVERIRFERNHDVVLTGYVPDVRPYLRRAACMIVPLRVGGGSRLKILDSWAMGKAVVSTPVGCEGLDARDGENILIRESPPEFAAGILSLLEETSLRTGIEKNARRVAEETYSWDAVAGILLGVYDELLQYAPVRSEEQAG